MTTTTVRVTARTLLVFGLASLLALQPARPAEAITSAFGFGATPSVAPSVAPYLRGITPGSVAAAQAAMGAAAAAVGGGTATTVSATGIAAATGPYAVAAGVGILIGWGIVESGLWDWATGPDPVPTSTTTTVQGNDFVIIHGFWTGPGPGAHTNDTEGYLDVEKGPKSYVGASSTWYFDCDADAGQHHHDQTLILSTEEVGSRSTTSSNCWGHYSTTDTFAGTVRIDTMDSTGIIDSFTPTTTEEPNDDRRVTTTADCIAKDNTVTQVTASSAWYVPGSEIANPVVSCPTGTVVGDVSIVREVSGDSTKDETLFSSDHATDQYPTTGDPAVDACFDGSCVLMIHEVQPDGTTRSCELATVVCTGWADVSEPTRSDTYRCLWGTNVMPLGDCEMFWEIDASTYVGPDPGVDSDLSTTTDRGVTPTQPTTAEPDPSSGCESGSWLNPFTKTARAVGCALEWAFVPDPATQTEVDALGNALGGKAPFGQVTQASSYVQDFSNLGQECWTVAPEILTYGTFAVVDTCAGDGVWAWLRGNRELMGSILYGSLLIGLAWWGWKAYAPGTVHGA